VGAEKERKQDTERDQKDGERAKETATQRKESGERGGERKRECVCV